MSLFRCADSKGVGPRARALEACVDARAHQHSVQLLCCLRPETNQRISLGYSGSGPAPRLGQRGYPQERSLERTRTRGPCTHQRLQVASAFAEYVRSRCLLATRGLGRVGTSASHTRGCTRVQAQNMPLASSALTAALHHSLGHRVLSGAWGTSKRNGSGKQWVLST